jgi:hypothetical protein
MNKVVYILRSKIDGGIVEYTFNEGEVDDMCIRNDYDERQFNSSFGLMKLTFEEMITLFKSSYKGSINDE